MGNDSRVEEVGRGARFCWGERNFIMPRLYRGI